MGISSLQDEARPKRKYRPRAAKRRDEAVALHGQGRTVREIAEAMGITTQGVYDHLHGAGIRLTEVQEQEKSA